MLFPIIIFIAIAAFMIFFTVSFFKKRRAFRERGVRVQATITDFRTVRIRRSTTHTCTIEYMADGERQTAKCGTKRRYEVGETVEAAYLPEDPKQVMLADDFDDTAANSVHGSILVGVCGVIVVAMAIGAFRIIAQGNKEAFIELCRSGTPEQIEAKIKGGASVNAKDKDYNTPLGIAARYNNDPEVLRLLIQAGAEDNIYLLTREAARYNGNPEVLRALIQAGADINDKSYADSTPLHSAAQNSNPEVLRLLIQAGADISAKDDYGNTPLMKAAGNNNDPEVLRLLIEAGADISAKNKNGRTALNLAAWKSKPEIVSLLLAAGANVSQNDLELAQKNNYLKDSAIIEELREKARGGDAGTSVNIEHLVGTWADIHSSDDKSNAAAEIYVFKADMTFERTRMMKMSSGSTSIDVRVKFIGNYWVSDDVLTLETNRRYTSTDGGKTFKTEFLSSTSAWRCTLGTDEDGIEYLELTGIGGSETETKAEKLYKQQ